MNKQNKLVEITIDTKNVQERGVDLRVTATSLSYEDLLWLEESIDRFCIEQTDFMKTMSEKDLAECDSHDRIEFMLIIREQLRIACRSNHINRLIKDCPPDKLIFKF